MIHSMTRIPQAAKSDILTDRKPLDSKHITIYNKENIDKALMLMIKDLEEKN